MKRGCTLLKSILIAFISYKDFLSNMFVARSLTNCELTFFYIKCALVNALYWKCIRIWRWEAIALNFTDFWIPRRMMVGSHSSACGKIYCMILYRVPSYRRCYLGFKKLLMTVSPEGLFLNGYSQYLEYSFCTGLL